MKIRITDDWAKACGKTQTVFDVIRTEQRMLPCPDERLFYIVDDGGREWTIWCIRVAEVDYHPVVKPEPVAADTILASRYRVFYPGISQDLSRDFASREAAEAFARQRRDAELHMWRHVRVEAVPPAGAVDTGVIHDVPEERNMSRPYVDPAVRKLRAVAASYDGWIKPGRVYAIDLRRDAEISNDMRYYWVHGRRYHAEHFEVV
jgi:hypothetical protein